MIIPKIKSVTIVLGKDVHVYEHGKNGVTEIQDKIREFESHTEFIIHIISNGAVKCELINLPMIIERFNG